MEGYTSVKVSFFSNNMLSFGLFVHILILNGLSDSQHMWK